VGRLSGGGQEFAALLAVVRRGVFCEELGSPGEAVGETKQMTILRQLIAEAGSWAHNTLLKKGLRKRPSGEKMPPL